MHRKEKLSFIRGTWLQLKRLNNTVYQLINKLNNEKRYAINYPNLKMRFIQEIENYKNYPELVCVEEFSMNYSFGYHYVHNIDDMRSRQAMFIEVKTYLNTLKLID